MSSARVLVVEDEAAMAEVVERYLLRDGHEVRVAGSGEAALETFRAFHPDIVVLDLMLPGIDGIELCRRIRTIADTPIIMLTARREEADRLLGFGAGADDYVTKPFSPRELAARVQAMLRRTGTSSPAGGTHLRFGDLTIDAAGRTVENSSREIALSAREFDLLSYLASNPGQVFTRDQLLDAVWDYHAVTDPNTVTVHVRRIRSKLEEDPSRPRYIKTVWGVGYKFEP